MPTKSRTKRVAVKHQFHYASGQKPKVGDVVKCLDNTPLDPNTLRKLRLSKRKHYVVTATGMDDDSDGKLYADVKLEGTDYPMFYHARRFELIRRAS